MTDVTPREKARGSTHDSDKQAAFVLAWAQHRRRLYALCKRWMGGSREDAEDVLGEIALRAIEEHEAQAVILNYPGWLTRIARNQCIDLHRERDSRRRTIERFTRESWVMPASGENHPEAAHLQLELGGCLQRAVDELPSRLREPCQRRFFEDAPYEDIAGELGLTNATVRKRIQQALELLYGRLDTYLRAETVRRGGGRASGAANVPPEGA